MGLVILAASVVELLIPPVTLLGQAKFPCLFSVVLYYSIARNDREMILAAFFCGLMYDIMSSVPLGASIIILGVMGIICGRFRRYLIQESIYAPLLFGFITGFVVTFIYYLVLPKSDLGEWYMRRVWLKSIRTGALSLICTPVVFLVTGALDKLTGNVEVREQIDDFE